MRHYSLLTKAMLAIVIAWLLTITTSFAQCVIPIVGGQTYIEDFDSGEMECWTVETTGAGTWAIMTGTASSVAAFQNAALGDEARLISPVFDMSGVGSGTFSFGYAMMALYDNDVLTVSYRSSETDNWHELDSYSLNDWTNTYEATFDLPNISSTYQISFLGQSNGGIYIFIDNIEITAAGGCARPVNVEVSEITAFSALFEWSTTGNEERWEIELNGHQTPVETQPFLMEGLEPETEYTLRVQAVCGEGMTSEWSYPISFKTSCDVITVTDDEPYFDDFEASEEFICWQNKIEFGDGGWVIDPGYLILNNTAFFIWLNKQAKLVSAPLDITAVTNPTLTFRHKQPFGSLGADELSVWYATGPNDSWHLLAEYTSIADEWEEASFALPEASDYYTIAFMGKSNDESGVYVDDVRVGSGDYDGIDEKTIMAIASPNPVADKVTISANIAEGEIEVYDLFGRRVAVVTLHEGCTTVDLGDFAKGVYMAQISDGNSITTIKLVKE